MVIYQLILVGRCMAVDRESVWHLFIFLSFCDLLVSFGCLCHFGHHFGVLGMTLGVLLGAFGAPWAPRGSPWRHFGLPLAPWGLRGAIWGTLGSQGELGMSLGLKMDVQFRANGSQVARLRTKSDLAQFSRVCRQCHVWAQSAAGAAPPNPTSLAPGARMT